MDFKGVFFNPNDFTLTKQMLGKGSFGTVYLATNNKDNQTYAAKLINVDTEIDGNDQMLIMRESTILAQLDHPSVLKFLGVNFRSLKNLKQFQPTIITEYLPNGSLKAILDKEKKSIADSNWSPTKKYICLIGIADAMRYLHEHGIMHRDLKPENILIDENYYPRICDFGLSRCFSEMMSRSMTGNIGTPLYMAPELLNEEEYGTPVDVYAFSILAYEILTGKEPYYDLGANLSNFLLLQKINEGTRPKFDNDVPEKMQELISSCWDSNPLKRPSFKEIFEMLKSDFSLSPEEVDEDEINEYLDTLNENNSDQKTTLINDCINEIKAQFKEIDDIERLLYFACQNNYINLVRNILSNKSVDINKINISNLI